MLGTQRNMILHTSFPFIEPAIDPTSGPAATRKLLDPSKATQVVTFRWTAVPQSLFDLVHRWSGGQYQESSKILQDITHRTPKRSFLSYQLSDNALLAEIQATVIPPFQTKSIKPSGSDNPRTKRRSTTTKKALVETNHSSQPLTTKITLVTVPTPTPAPSQPLNRDDHQLAKRRKSASSRASTVPPPISCHHCGQTDVPLMMGGRFCRQCIDKGHAVSDIPPATPVNTYRSWDYGRGGSSDVTVTAPSSDYGRLWNLEQMAYPPYSSQVPADDHSFQQPAGRSGMATPTTEGSQTARVQPTYAANSTAYFYAKNPPQDHGSSR